MKRINIIIRGRVQGIGFRPTIYRAAKKLNLNGWIKNIREGVFLEIEGQSKIVDYFIKNLKKLSPPQAIIEKISIKNLQVKGLTKFRILKSIPSGKNYLLLPPDIAICSVCHKELFNPGNRRFLYPFINCTSCGPRFSITKEVPYDRINTTMSSFIMCPACQKEFDNPLTRRFHAQPNACSICGPKVSLTLPSGKKIISSDPIKKAVDLLKKGKILAIRGVGGFHLCCDALNTEAVSRLRKRKNRPYKPFAIIVPDLVAAKGFSFITEKEKEVLMSFERPIVLLKKKKNIKIPEMVAPGNKYLGIMLPYTPLHYLLFYPPRADKFHALVMTSGNISDEPISRTNSEAYTELGQIADYFLVHNREIFNRCDDSIVFLAGNGIRISRRARGYVPNAFPLTLSEDKTNFHGRERGVNISAPKKNIDILACGADMKSSFSLFTKGKVFLSQYIGELHDEKTLKFFKEVLSRLTKITDAKPKIVFHDLHPDYLSTNFARQYAEKYHLKSFGFQHHQSHIASIAAEEKINPPFIGVAFDGTGYGLDGKIWGGEFFVFEKDKILRAAHLDYFPLPGGEEAVKKIWRIAYGLSDRLVIPRYIDKKNREKIDVIQKMIETKTNTPLTSSMGRLFDAVSYVLDVTNKVTYEAQAAIELESLCRNKPKNGYPVFWEKQNSDYPFESKKKIIIDTKKIILYVLNDKEKGVAIEKIAEKFHLTIVKLIYEIAENLASTHKTDKILLSGGVFQNRVLVDWLTEEMENKKIKTYFNKLVPTNDGGIALGQLWLGMNYLASKKI